MKLYWVCDVKGTDGNADVIYKCIECYEENAPITVTESTKDCRHPKWCEHVLCSMVEEPF